MKLIIGGTCQGKTAYLTEQLGISKEHVLCGEEIAKAVCDGAEKAELAENGVSYLENEQIKAINHLHLYIRESLKKGLTQNEIQSEILSWLEKNPNLILVSDEIGYGIVPMDVFEREYREVAGRICCVLAQKADMVIRVCCGLGNIIKGQ